MTILEDFKQGKSFSLKYYGKNDLDTSYTIKTIIENNHLFEKILEKKIDSINNMDDYYLSLITRKISSLKECSKYVIGDDNKRTVDKLILKAKESETTNGEFIKFINTNARAVFENDSYDLQEVTFDIIKKYQNGISREVFEYLIREKYRYFLLYFDDFKFWKKDRELLQKVIDNNLVSHLGDSYTIKQIIRICLVVINYRKTDYTDFVDKTIDKIFKNYLELSKDSNQYNELFEAFDIGKSLFQYFKIRKDSRANEIRYTNLKLEKAMSDSMLEDGIEIEYKIPIKEIMEKWNGVKNPIIRMLSLTHENENGHIKSHLSIENVENGLMDIVTSNISTDDYYTLSRQEVIKSIGSLGCAVIYGILQNDEYFSIYYNDFLHILSYVIKNSDTYDDLLVEGEMLVQNLEILRANVLNQNNSDTFIQKTLSYNVEMLCCGLIESLMRLQYQIKNEKIIYIDYSKATLGQLLNPEKNVTSSFSKDQLLTLAFFLVGSGENNDIGYNYRNKLAHLVDVYKNVLSIDVACLLLYLLTDVLNTIFLDISHFKEEK